MKRTLFYIFVGLTLLYSVSSCSGKKKPVNGRTDTPVSGTISFYADESFSPIVEELRQQFEYEFPEAHLKPIYTDETTGHIFLSLPVGCCRVKWLILKPRRIKFHV